LDSEERVGWRN